MDDEFLSLNEDTDTDYVVECITEEEKSLAYGLYAKIKNYQFHYNSVKIRYKILLGTWVLATFIGIGYILAGEEGNLPFDKLSAVSLLSFISGVGVNLLFFLDVSIYHRLIEALFASTLNFEKKYSFLTRTNHNIAKLLIRGKTGPVILDGLFYAYFSTVLFLISAVSFLIRSCIFCKTLSFVLFFASLALIIVWDIYLLQAAHGSGIMTLFKKRKIRHDGDI